MQLVSFASRCKPLLLLASCVDAALLANVPHVQRLASSSTGLKREGEGFHKLPDVPLTSPVGIVTSDLSAR